MLAPVKGRGTAPALSINARFQDQDTLSQIPIATAEITQHYNSPRNRSTVRAALLSIQGWLRCPAKCLKARFPKRLLVEARVRRDPSLAAGTNRGFCYTQISRRENSIWLITR